MLSAFLIALWSHHWLNSLQLCGMIDVSSPPPKKFMIIFMRLFVFSNLSLAVITNRDKQLLDCPLFEPIFLLFLCFQTYDKDFPTEDSIWLYGIWRSVQMEGLVHNATLLHFHAVFVSFPLFHNIK
jgi:hypothetical protein